MKKIIKNLMVVAVATLALAAFTGCSAAPADPEAPAAPETPETPETPGNDESTKKGVLETNFPYMIRKFNFPHNSLDTLEFTKDDTFIIVQYDYYGVATTYIGPVTLEYMWDDDDIDNYDEELGAYSELRLKPTTVIENDVAKLQDWVFSELDKGLDLFVDIPFDYRTVRYFKQYTEGYREYARKFQFNDN